MSFFSKIESWFTKIYGKAPTWEKTASATLTVAAPLVETIVTLVAGEPTAAAVGVVVSQVQSDVAAVAALISTAGPAPSISSILNAITGNLKALLTAGDIKDATTLTKVESVVNLVVGEFEAILKVVPAA